MSWTISPGLRLAGLLLVALGLPACGGEAEAKGVPQQEEVIDPQVLARMEGDRPIPVAIMLRNQLLLGPGALEEFTMEAGARSRSVLRAEVVQTLKGAAGREQPALLSALGSPSGSRGLWIANVLFVTLTNDQIHTAAQHELVRYVYLMPREPSAFDRPGRVSTVLTGRTRSLFSVEGKRIPWNLQAIGAAKVWEDLGVTGEGSIVVMIDNGTNYTHPDLTSNIWTNTDEVPNNDRDDDGNGLIDDYYGFDFAQGLTEVMLDPALENRAGHGTYTAGIVAGDGTGGTVTGVAPRARLMITKVGGDTYALGRALEYALEEGADVATMSFSIPDLGNVRGLWRLMADNAVAAGLVQVSGAGNFQQSVAPGVQQRIPEGIPSVISVGGVDQSLELAPFSSLGPVSWASVRFYGDHRSLTKPDVAAFPGPEYPILLAEGSGYLDPNTRRGNSFSGPHAAGVAALMLSANPELRAWEVKEILQATAHDLPPAGRDNRTGAGLIDAFAAVQEALARR